jgi:membrane-associated phospholipid phosphatase
MFAVFTVLAMGPLGEVDVVLSEELPGQGGRLYPLLAFLAHMGERGILLPFILALAGWLARTRRTWEPVIAVAVATVAVNLLVGGCKILTARGGPGVGDPAFFEGGMLYPSGHTANVVLYFGLAVVLARQYGDPGGRPARVLLWLAWAACLLMVGIALYRQVHWFTDVVGGLLVGAAVLRSTAYDRGLLRRLTGCASAAHLLVSRRRRQAASGMPDPRHLVAAGSQPRDRED